MIYVVEIGLKEFIFEEATTATAFTEVAVTHSAKPMTAKIEVRKEEESDAD